MLKNSIEYFNTPATLAPSAESPVLSLLPDYSVLPPEPAPRYLRLVIHVIVGRADIADLREVFRVRADYEVDAAFDDYCGEKISRRVHVSAHEEVRLELGVVYRRVLIQVDSLGARRYVSESVSKWGSSI